MDIKNRIRQFIVTSLYYNADLSLGDDDSFLATGVIDSMGVMELVGFVESEFGIKLAPDELVVENFDSIRKLAEFIERKLGWKASHGKQTVGELKPVSASN